jgi:hypothetical protein
MKNKITAEHISCQAPFLVDPDPAHSNAGDNQRALDRLSKHIALRKPHCFSRLVHPVYI